MLTKTLALIARFAKAVVDDRLLWVSKAGIAPVAERPLPDTDNVIAFGVVWLAMRMERFPNPAFDISAAEIRE